LRLAHDGARASRPGAFLFAADADNGFPDSQPPAVKVDVRPGGNSYPQPVSIVVYRRQAANPACGALRMAGFALNPVTDRLADRVVDR